MDAPDIPDTQLAENASTFLKECLNDMDHTWGHMIYEILTCLVFGWAWLEMVLKIRGGDTRNPKTRSRFDDGKIGFRKIALRLQSSLDSWKFNEDGYVTDFVQVNNIQGARKEISINKSLLFRVGATGSNPEGESVLRSAYRPWYIKKNIEEIEAIGIERDLIGMPIITGPDGFDIDAAKNKKIKMYIGNVFKSLRRDERDGVFMPFGWTISLLSGQGNSKRQFDTDKVINRYDKRIAMSVLTHAILLGSDRVGSFALSQTQTNDFFKVAVQGYLQIISEEFNKFAVPYLFAFNPSFDDLKGKYPMLVPGKISAPTLKDVGTFISDVAGAGFLVRDGELVAEIESALLRLGEFEEASRSGRVDVMGARKRPVIGPIVDPNADPNDNNNSGGSGSGSGSSE